MSTRRQQLEKKFSLDVSGSVLSFHNIEYKVQIKKGMCGGTFTKDILLGIDGYFKPGMNAIMGPTGGGKSSLLDVLAGRKDPAGLTGDVLVDGEKQPANFKCMSGYVVQDDIVWGALTVFENIMMSANLRLPTTVSHAEKAEAVKQTVMELGLSHVSNAKVGNEFIRGISGGERKRTNIGMELIISPSVLFLDEPTTGLDASTANSVMSLLQTVSQKGRTIVFSIHQPRYSIFRLFDRFMLLGRGKTVYHGPADQALDFFNSMGYEIESFNNPPDFFLDVVNGDAMPNQNANANTSRELDAIPLHDAGENPAIMSATNGRVVIELDNLDDEKDSSKKITYLTGKLSERFMQSQWNLRLQEDLRPIAEQYATNKQQGQKSPEQPDYATSFLTQLYYLSQRTVLNIVRNPVASIMQVVVMIMFGFIVGLLYYQLENEYRSGVQNRVGAFFFIIMNMVFGNLSAVEMFIKERVFFIHENVSGFYRVSSYFMTKVCCDLIPMRALPVIAFACICYFMVGLQADVGKFFFFLLTLVLTCLASVSIGFAVSASVSTFAIANLLIALIYVFMMVFGGLLVNVSDIVVWLRWLQYFSIFRYGLNALAINELTGLTFCLPDTENITGTPCLDHIEGEAYFEEQAIDYGTPWDLWKNIVAQAIITFGLLLLSYIQLVRTKKLK